MTILRGAAGNPSNTFFSYVTDWVRPRGKRASGVPPRTRPFVRLAALGALRVLRRVAGGDDDDPYAHWDGAAPSPPSATAAGEWRGAWGDGQQRRAPATEGNASDAQWGAPQSAPSTATAQQADFLAFCGPADGQGQRAKIGTTTAADRKGGRSPSPFCWRARRGRNGWSGCRHHVPAALIIHQSKPTYERT